MSIITSTTIVLLIVLLAIIIGIVYLQIYLSKLANKWLGLILPGITFITSSSVVIARVLYGGDLESVLLTSLIVFLMYNIPTLILIAIYIVQRKKIKKNAGLEKMNIQDLG